MQEITKQYKTGYFSTSTLVKVAILSSICYVLMFLQFPIPALFPDFLKIDISDVPAILGGMALGPVAGITIELIKNILQALTNTQTGGVGELANFLIGGSFVLVTSVIYRRKKDLKGSIIALILGTIFMTAVGALANYYILIPFYTNFMPMEAIIGMGSELNPKIVDLPTYILWMVAPFNIIKGILMSIIIVLIYKKVEPILKKG
jgi:riboflavin transporter FmnP